MNIVFLALFLIVHNPADAATPNKPFLSFDCIEDETCSARYIVHVRDDAQKRNTRLSLQVAFSVTFCICCTHISCNFRKKWTRVM